MLSFPDTLLIKSYISYMQTHKENKMWNLQGRVTCLLHQDFFHLLSAAHRVHMPMNFNFKTNRVGSNADSQLTKLAKAHVRHDYTVSSTSSISQEGLSDEQIRKHFKLDQMSYTRWPMMCGCVWVQFCC